MILNCHMDLGMIPSLLQEQEVLLTTESHPVIFPVLFVYVFVLFNNLLSLV